MNRAKLFLLIVWSLLAACTTTVKQVEVKQAIEITDRSKVKPIAITKVAAKMRRGTVLGKIGGGAACIPYLDLTWRTGSTNSLSSEDLVDIFREELERSGWPVVGSDDLFTGYDVSGAEVLVAARIIDIKSNMCMPLIGFGNTNTKGSMRMVVEWQVYSPARKTLIGKVETKGSNEIKKASDSDNAAYELLNGSFSVAVNNLLASKEFMAMVEKSSGLVRAPGVDGAQLIPNKRVSYRTLEAAIVAAKKSTIIVRRAGAHGSGFAVGDGSYVLTNSHVVGDAANVTLVSSGGLSISGVVVKVSRERDVALIKLNGVRLPPLHVNTRIPQSPARVYAIGAPLAEELGGSVTSGVVSGTRMFEGYPWIQSDAAISPGNSGGPLLDAYGSVVGISTAGFQPRGSQVGLNLFIPIESALSYSGLKIDNRH